MEISMSEKIQINNEAIFRINVDGTVVVMKMDDDNNFFKITGIAAKIWKALSEEQKSINEMVDDVANEYDAPFETVKLDCQKFIEKLIMLDLVRSM